MDQENFQLEKVDNFEVMEARHTNVSLEKSDFKARFCTEQISHKKLYKNSCFAD